SNEDSDRLSQQSGPILIVAGSGMMNGGRILRHLYRRIEDQKTNLMIIGFQAPGTLGHRITQGARTVTLYGRKRRVRARVEQLYGFSAHADKPELMSFLTSLHENAPQHVFCVHGSPNACRELTRLVKKHLRCLATAPEIGQRFVLA
ncbi:MAG: MBL fold metallo-hydrolase RNA specificity domain-containing protein, partial [Promethearchaeota archaeon]